MLVIKHMLPRNMVKLLILYKAAVEITEEFEEVKHEKIYKEICYYTMCVYDNF